MRAEHFSFIVMTFAALILRPAHAQQAAPPPAVLVQPAELRSMSKQFEFVGRAEALEKVDFPPRRRSPMPISNSRAPPS